MGEIAAISAVVLFFGGLWIGYWFRGFDVNDLEIENCELRDVNKDLLNDLVNANALVSDSVNSTHYWRTKYEDLVEAVKNKAAEKPTEKPKKATSKK